MLVKVQGIVIRSRDYGEGNKILTLFSPDVGKVSVMARGAKKTKSRLSSISQLFTYGHYLFYKGSSVNSMGSLSQGEIIESFRDLRSDLTKTAYAAYFAELLDRITAEGEANPYLFQLLLTTFQYVDEGKDAEILARLYELKILIAGGYRPQLDQCTQCAVQEGVFGFSIKEGGLLCQECRHIDPESLSLKPKTIQLLRLLYYFEIHRLGNINVKKETKEELRRTLWQFMDYHTPLRLKSRSFLEQMNTFL